MFGNEIFIPIFALFFENYGEVMAIDWRVWV
jgi:hypothetical protein